MKLLLMISLVVFSACDQSKTCVREVPTDINSILKTACVRGGGEINDLRLSRLDLEALKEEHYDDKKSPSGRLLVAYCFQEKPIQYLATIYEGPISLPFPVPTDCERRLDDGALFCPPKTPAAWARVLSNQRCESMISISEKWSLKWDMKQPVSPSDFTVTVKGLLGPNYQVWIPVDDHCWLEATQKKM